MLIYRRLSKTTMEIEKTFTIQDGEKVGDFHGFFLVQSILLKLFNRPWLIGFGVLRKEIRLPGETLGDDELSHSRFPPIDQVVLLEMGKRCCICMAHLVG